MEPSTFTELARAADPPLDRLALAISTELGVEACDEAGTLGRLDALGAELAGTLAGLHGRTPAAEIAATAEVLGARHGFHGEAADYDAPERSMLDRVLEERVGLPIVLSVLYVEVARRAGVALAGVGLPGHFVVAHFGSEPPVLADPFHGGRPVPEALAPRLVRPWTAQETVRRMLNNLVVGYMGRHDLGRAIRAAELRLAVAGSDREALELELRSLRARLN